MVGSKGEPEEMRAAGARGVCHAVTRYSVAAANWASYSA